MKFSTIASLLTTAASVTMAQPVDESAAATPSNADSSLPFGLMSLRSATAIHFASTSAAQGNLWLNLPNQDAKCHPAGQDNDGWAVFYLKNDRLYLYNGGKQETQRFYTDRSSKGQGKLGYLTGDQPPPRNAEVKGFAIENENLTFRGKGLIACPSQVYPDSWSVWVDVGIANPGGNKGCLGFSARQLTPWIDPVGCQYSQ